RCHRQEGGLDDVLATRGLLDLLQSRAQPGLELEGQGDGFVERQRPARHAVPDHRLRRTPTGVGPTRSLARRGQFREAWGFPGGVGGWGVARASFAPPSPPPPPPPPPPTPPRRSPAPLPRCPAALTRLKARGCAQRRWPGPGAPAQRSPWSPRTAGSSRLPPP